MSEKMSREPDNTRSRLLTRRDFIGALAGAGAALGSIPTWQVDVAQSTASRRPIVSIHMDQPYLDWSGTAMPYYPPAGSRSAQILAKLDEESLRLYHCYL
jgi:hypothetical protein